MKLVLHLLIALSFSVASLGYAQTEDAKLAAFFRERLDAGFQLNPVEATSTGEHRYDHLLGDVSASARERWVEHGRTTLAALPQKIEHSRLTRAGQIDFDIFEHDLRKSLWLAENFDPFVTDPRTYSQYISGAVYHLLAQSSLPREVNVSNAIARITQVPGILASARANLQNPPRIYVETAIRQNQGSISFYEREVYELAGKTRQLGALKSAGEKILPALRDYQKFLEQDLLPRATGEWRIGPQKFARKLELEMDAGLTADQVYADAQAEFTRVRNDMYVIARQLWSRCFPRKPLPPDDAIGRRDTVESVLRRVAQDHADAATIVRDIRREVTRVKEFIAAHDILPCPNPTSVVSSRCPSFSVAIPSPL